MPGNDKTPSVSVAKVFLLAKAACFATCVALFFWEVGRSADVLGRKATRTDIDYVSSKRLPVPLLAVCRHPYQVENLLSKMFHDKRCSILCTY